MPENITPPGRFWIVRKPDSQGTIVAKFETTADDPQSITQAIPESCITQTVADRSALTDKSTDPTALSDEEREILGV